MSVLRSSLSRGAAVVTMATGLGVGLLASPAYAATEAPPPIIVKLDVSAGAEPFTITVAGLIPMSLAEANKELEEQSTMQLRLWGEDKCGNDLLIGPYFAQGPMGTSVSTLSPNERGIVFVSTVQAPAKLLDEDEEGGEDQADTLDELFVEVRFVDSDGDTIREIDTNKVVRQFGTAPKPASAA